MTNPPARGRSQRFGWRRLVPAGVFALAAFLFLFRLGGIPLIDPDEGRNARVAVEMNEGGTWLVPTLDGLPYMDKPGLYFSAVAASLRAFGVSENAARLPSALCGIVLLTGMYFWARRTYCGRTGAISVVILATSPLVLAFSRIVILDIFLALFTCIAILAGFESCFDDSRRGRITSAASFASMAAATMIKGPVGFIVPIVVLVATCFVNRRPAALGRLFRPLSIALFFAISLGWFFLVLRARPDFAHYGLVEETVRRYSTNSFRRSGPFWYYTAVGPAVFLPWSIFAAAGLWMMRRKWRAARAETRMLVVWAGAVVLFFSTSSSKLPGYILTSVVASGVLVARLVDLAWSGDDGARRAMHRGNWIAAGLCLTLAVLLAWGAEHGALHGLREQSVEWARARTLMAPMAWTLVAMGSGFGAAAVLGRPAVSLLAGCVLSVSLLTVCFPGLRAYAWEASSRPLSAIVSSQIQEDDRTIVAAVDCFPVGALYYLRRPILLFSKDGHELTSEYAAYCLRHGADLSARIRRTESLEAWLEANRDRSVYLIGKGKSRPRLGGIATSRGAGLTQLPRGYWGLALPGAEVDVD